MSNEIVLSRLAKSRIALSPDGQVRVECEYEPHERTAAWETLRIFVTKENRLILRLPRFYFEQEVEFPQLGTVDILLQGRYGQRHRLRVNVAHETFLLDLDAAEQPLAFLEERLTREAPKRLLGYRPLKRRRAWLELMATAVLSILLVGGCIGMSLAGRTSRIRAMGAMSAVLFGIVAIVAVIVLLRGYLRRRRY
jgi:hypothetical protein